MIKRQPETVMWFSGCLGLCIELRIVTQAIVEVVECGEMVQRGVNGIVLGGVADGRFAKGLRTVSCGETATVAVVFLDDF